MSQNRTKKKKEAKRVATELEFAAKQMNDVLAKRFPNRKLEFMSFVFDYGGGALGYVSSTRRIDAYRAITEWLHRTVKEFSRADLIEMLKLYEKELGESGE